MERNASRAAMHSEMDRLFRLIGHEALCWQMVLQLFI